jgi:uncharacterized protein (TIGR00296 family)
MTLDFQFTTGGFKPMIATIEMVAVCFIALTKKLSNDPPQQLVSTTLPSFDNVVEGLFVTWYNGKQLRGCIGALKPINLGRGLTEYSLIAALEDKRFVPITSDEIKQLECKISILFSFEDCELWNDWTVGMHGIILRFTSMGQFYSATFLPEVMIEQGWSQETTILKAIQKSGFPLHFGTSIDAFIVTVSDFSLVRYQSSVASMTYYEYMQTISK